MNCCVCGDANEVNDYRVTGRHMAARVVRYCPACAQYVQTILPFGGGAAIKVEPMRRAS